MNILQTINKKYLKTNSLRTLFTTSFFFIISLVLGLIITPKLVYFLGPVSYGAYKIIQKYLGLGQVAEGRISQTLKLLISKNLTDNEVDKSGLLRSSILVWKSYLPFMIIVLGLFSFFVPMTFSELNDNVFFYRIVMLLFSINLLIMSLCGIFESIWNGTNRAFRLLTLNIIWLSLLNVFIYFVLPIKPSLITLAFITIACSSGRLIHLYRKTKKKYIWVSFSNDIIPVKLSDFKKLNIQNILWTLINRILFSFDILLIGYLFGTSVVTDISLMAYVSVMLISVFSLVPSSILPTLSALSNEQSSTKTVVSLMVKTRSYLTNVSGSVLILIMLLNQSFLSIWLGADTEVYRGDLINLLICTHIYVILCLKIDLLFMNALLEIFRKIKYVSIYLGLVLVLILSLNYFLDLLTIENLYLIIIFTLLPLKFFISYKTNQLAGGEKSKKSLVILFYLLLFVIVFFLNESFWLTSIIVFLLLINIIWRTLFFLPYMNNKINDV